MSESEMLTRHEVAAMLNVTVLTVSNWEAQGRIPAAWREGRIVRWRRSEIEAWLKSRTTQWVAQEDRQCPR